MIINLIDIMTGITLINMAAMDLLNLMVIAAYAAVSLIIYVLYIVAVEAANRRLSRVFKGWRWYYGYIVLAISLSLVLDYFRMIDYESGIFINLPGIVIYDQLDKALARMGVYAPYLPLMTISSIIAWLLIGLGVRMVKGRKGG